MSNEIALKTAEFIEKKRGNNRVNLSWFGCWYPVRAQEIVKQGGTAGNVYDPSLTEEDSVMGGFFVTFSEPMAR